MLVERRLRVQNVQKEIFGRWGLSINHRTTCLLIPKFWHLEDWKGMYAAFTYGGSNIIKPLDYKLLHILSGSFNGEQSKYMANFDKVAAFGTIQRSDDDFQRTWMVNKANVAHPCGHKLCIVHQTIECPDATSGRETCFENAKALRIQGSAIPWYCTKHNPTCILHMSVLTIVEAFNVAFWV
ncbi:hypothetical protein N431DRAFT_457671 [Stipitochalara longipes BDJ]|nr:hypothetical protein N431DRAFT_457671 [Stipitochalara longipes BDJ]